MKTLSFERAAISFSVLILCLSLSCGSARGEELNLTTKKILVVMSYHEDYPWHVETREGIESVLGDAAITYFYMDSKRNLEGAEAKGKAAFALYQALQPDVVIAADDNAQSMFVVPFLKNRVKTPVIFCGVNDDATKYGYPAANVTGILEKKHYRESISLIQIVAPKIKKIAVLYRETPSNLTNLAQIAKEKAHFKAEIVATVKVSSEDDLAPALQSLENRADALLVLNLSGLSGSNGNPLSATEAIELVTRFWTKPTLGVSSWEVKSGILCAVAKQGQEQGIVASGLAIQTMAGQSAASIPITQNRNGRRVINVNSAKSLGIRLKPIALIGAELVK